MSYLLFIKLSTIIFFLLLLLLLLLLTCARMQSVATKSLKKKRPLLEGKANLIIVLKLN